MELVRWILMLESRKAYHKKIFTSGFFVAQMWSRSWPSPWCRTETMATGPSQHHWTIKPTFNMVDQQWFWRKIVIKRKTQERRLCKLGHSCYTWLNPNWRAQGEKNYLGHITPAPRITFFTSPTAEAACCNLKPVLPNSYWNNLLWFYSPPSLTNQSH